LKFFASYCIINKNIIIGVYYGSTKKKHTKREANRYIIMPPTASPNYNFTITTFNI